MPTISPLSIVDPASLPHVWRVSDLASENAVLPTGHALLDPVLPGGGWPSGSMIEVLQQRPGQHVWQLLGPVLARAVADSVGPVILVGAPYQPFVPSLKAQGLAAERFLCIHAEKSSARLWATEQALRCTEVSAVLAWLPDAKHEELRRLHMASQQFRRLLFIFRGGKSRREASPASLRVLVDGVDTLCLHILKRRGPPLLVPVELASHSARVAALLQARRARASQGSAPTQRHSFEQGSHVLDRISSIA